MEISSDQALDALAEVQEAQRRISVLRGYGFAAPHFLLWGSIWVVGFLLTYLFPAQAGRIGVGIWRGLRWAIAGLVLAALVLVGYFLLRQYLLLWMAVAGGGTLLTSGFWLRRA